MRVDGTCAPWQPPCTALGGKQLARRLLLRARERAPLAASLDAARCQRCRSFGRPDAAHRACTSAGGLSHQIVACELAPAGRESLAGAPFPLRVLPSGPWSRVDDARGPGGALRAHRRHARSVTGLPQSGAMPRRPPSCCPADSQKSPASSCQSRRSFASLFACSLPQLAPRRSHTCMATSSYVLTWCEPASTARPVASSWQTLLLHPAVKVRCLHQTIGTVAHSIVGRGRTVAGFGTSLLVPTGAVGAAVAATL